MALLIFLSLLATEPETPLPKGVPKDAGLIIVSDDARVYHWRRPGSDSQREDIWILPVIDAWPENSWGVQSRLTPQPLCCGAKQSILRWRKSQRIRPTITGWVPKNSAYHLELTFLSNKSCPHCP